MGETTGIAWCDATFNPFWGCTKVSPGCTNCYAETIARRFGHDIWGPKAQRRFFGVTHWDAPFDWNADAERSGRRLRVFCGSMCDLFEDWPGMGPDGATFDNQRAVLWDMIDKTPALDWLLLTKRPENIEKMVPADWLERRRSNVRFGFTAEDQKRFNERWQAVKYMVRRGYSTFASCEPLLERVDLSPWGHLDDYLAGSRNWVIVGCESGPHRRPMQLDWALGIVRQCKAANVPCFVKQIEVSGKVSHDPQEWPEALRTQEFPG